MCLIIKNNTKRRTARKDITVYKLVVKRDGKYFTPYRFAPVEIGKTYYSELIRYNKGVSNRPAVNVGIHSFVDLSSVIELKAIHEHGVYAMCTIPKGSKYYVGNNGDIASNALRYDKI